VSGAGHETEQLRDAVHKVGHLGQEEKEHRLAEVAQNRYHSERHTGEVAECVAYKYA